MTTPTRPSIRVANADDVMRITTFNRALALETEARELPAATVEQGVANFLADSRRGTYFVAEREGTVVGQAAVTYEWSDWRNGEFWWLQSVYVVPPQRGQGVFRALYRHIEVLARAQPNCCGLRLYMEHDNSTARRTYLGLGMKESGYEVFEQVF